MIGNNTSSKKGFTILYAVLTASLLMSIGLGILDIALRDFNLAQMASESQVALSAADAGLECALYYDRKDGGGNLAFATSSLSAATAKVFRCGVPYGFGGSANGGHVSTTALYDSGTDTAVTTFTVYLIGQIGLTVADPAAPCAVVTVIKTGGGGSTAIESRGYNICEATSVTTRRVERGLSATY